MCAIKTHLTEIKRILFIVLLTVIFKSPCFVYPIWNMDEAISAVIGTSIVDGGVPYKDAIDHRGPITYYFYAMAFLIGGNNNMAVVHLIDIILSILTTVILFKLGKIFLDNRMAFISSISFIILSTSVWSFSDVFAFHTEKPMILFTTLGMYVFLYDLVYKDHIILKLLCGCIFALAFFSKQPSIFDFASIFIFLLFCKYNYSLNEFFRKSIIYISGFFIVSIII
ncbi:MAG: glycosyltransferase family 39 protein, partial [Candidatus Omnitrophica bacterium]|nr:glycosyltransferase family 39 protein [Candidatus Omnitrophota bacterium]